MITELKKRPGPWMGWKSHWKKYISKCCCGFQEDRLDDSYVTQNNGHKAFDISELSDAIIKPAKQSEIL
jgi:hypothetical protein